MKLSLKNGLLITALLCPLFCLAQSEMTGLHFKAEVLSFFNLLVLVTSIISIRQFLWPGDRNYSPFHLINILLVIVFFSIGLSFLIHNKSEYVGYEHLTSGQCVTKFFFSPDVDSLKQWVIVCGVVVNVLYIVRKRRDVI